MGAIKAAVVLTSLSVYSTTQETDHRLRISHMETLLVKQSTAGDKIITPSRDLLPLQPVGGRNVCCGAVAVWR